jgi:serine/threonine protein kinase
MCPLFFVQFVHRNLASRNILLTSDLKVKISNHASYHDLSNSEFLALMTSRNVMAMRWMAPESLSDHIFDFKSDVWSFGIVLWEIMSYGSSPYPKLGGDQDELRKAICSGYQMEQPEYCTDQM